jgi:hypothetical protein
MSHIKFNPVIAFVHMFTLTSTAFISYVLLSSYVLAHSSPKLIFALAVVLSLLISHVLYVVGGLVSRIAIRHKCDEPYEGQSDALYYLIQRNTGMNISVSLLTLMNKFINAFLKREVTLRESSYYNELVACTTVLWIALLGITSFHYLPVHHQTACPLTRRSDGLSIGDCSQ